jgi:GTP-binding protein
MEGGYVFDWQPTLNAEAVRQGPRGSDNRLV